MHPDTSGKMLTPPVATCPTEPAVTASAKEGEPKLNNQITFYFNLHPALTDSYCCGRARQSTQFSISIPLSLSKSEVFLVTSVRLFEIAVAPINRSKSSKGTPLFLNLAFSFA